MAQLRVVSSVKADIQKTESDPREIDQRKLATGTMREPHLMSRGIERPTVRGTTQTVTVTQVALPALAGARKYADLHTERMSKVLIPTT